MPGGGFSRSSRDGYTIGEWHLRRRRRALVGYTRVSSPNGQGGEDCNEQGRSSVGGVDYDYSVSGSNSADGSSSWGRQETSSERRPDQRPSATRQRGHGSFSSRTVHGDKSVTLVTRTTDKNGNGQEKVLKVDKDGNVLIDETKEVRGNSGGSGGGKGGQASANPNDPSTNGAVTAPDVEAMPTDQGGADAPWGPLRRIGEPSKAIN